MYLARVDFAGYEQTLAVRAANEPATRATVHRYCLGDVTEANLAHCWMIRRCHNESQYRKEKLHESWVLSNALVRPVTKGSGGPRFLRTLMFRSGQSYHTKSFSYQDREHSRHFPNFVHKLYNFTTLSNLYKQSQQQRLPWPCRRFSAKYNKGSSCTYTKQILVLGHGKRQQA